MGIKVKRSAVVGKAPVVADLELGELAVNTWDGKLYLRKNDGADAIVEVGPVRSVAGRTGSVTLAIADVASLQAALDGKQAAGSYAAASHTHAIANVTGLQTALDAKASLADIVGKQTIWLPAGAMTARATNGASSLTEELAANDIMVRSWAFDAAVSEAVQAMIRMPKGWNEGTLEVEFLWKHPATTTAFGVRWSVRARAFGDDDALDAAWGVAQGVSDTGGTTGDLYKTAFTAAVTIAGSPAEGDLVVLEISRDPAHAGDTMTADAHLIGVTVLYATSAARDD
jgi:hypothetical protein